MQWRLQRLPLLNVGLFRGEALGHFVQYHRSIGVARNRCLGGIAPSECIIWITSPVGRRGMRVMKKRSVNR
jgi:hypothetical protein